MICKRWGTDLSSFFHEQPEEKIVYEHAECVSEDAELAADLLAG